MPTSLKDIHIYMITRDCGKNYTTTVIDFIDDDLISILYIISHDERMYTYIELNIYIYT